MGKTKDKKPPDDPTSGLRGVWSCLTTIGLCVSIAGGLWGSSGGSGAGSDVGPLRWVPGDAHLHTEAVAQPNIGVVEHSLTPDQVFDEMKAQQLQVGSLLVWGLRPERTAGFFTGRDLERDGRVIRVDLEVSDFCGFVDHIIPLGLKDLEFPRRLYSYPIYKWAVDHGAVVGAAHAHHWAPNLGSYPDRRTQGPDELPLCLALGLPLYLLTEGLDSDAFRTLYYSLLSCGFQVPLVGGSDWPVAGGRAGDVRTYSGVRGPLCYDAWLDGIRRGRTTIAVGPTDLLVPTLEGRLCGETLLATPGQQLRLEVQVVSSQPQQLEVIINGEVAARTPLDVGARQVQLMLTLKDSAWVCVRTKRAHSGAIYALAGGRPIRASAPAAEYFLGFVDVLEDELRQPSFSQNLNGTNLTTPEAIEAERKEAIETYEKARPVFQKILEECRARAALLAQSPGAR